MNFDKLTYDQTMILAEAWTEFSAEDRAAAARSLGATEEYLRRILGQYRNLEEKRRQQQHKWLADLLSTPSAPDTEATMPLERATRPLEAPEAPEPVQTPTSAQIAPQTAPEEIGAMPHVLLKGAVVDIECTDFGTEGYSGYLVAVCVLPLGGESVITYRIEYDEHGDDRRLVREALDALSRYDIIIGHNLAAFDLNWLHSRWLFHDIRGSDVGDWPRWLYADTYQMAKTTAVKTRKGLGNLGDYFGLGGEKTSIYRTAWNNVRSPYRGDFDEAMSDIIYHCQQDVTLNRNLFDALWIDALAQRNNPLKVSKWGYIPGNRQRGCAAELPAPFVAPVLRLLEAEDAA